MKTPIHDAIVRQTDVLLANVQVLVDIHRSNSSESSDWGFDEQLFHLATSLDKWFIDPGSERAKAVDSLRSHRKRLDPDEMSAYFAEVSDGIRRYLDGAPDWEGHPEGCAWSRLELVMAQDRHAMHHVGYLHAWLRERGCEAPTWKGLGKA